jgi:hypothetical protein
MSSLEIVRSIINTVRGAVDSLENYDELKQRLGKSKLSKQLDEIVLPKIQDELLFVGITVEHFKQHPHAFFYWIAQNPMLALFSNTEEYRAHCGPDSIVAGEWRAAEGTVLQPILEEVKAGREKNEAEEEEDEEETWCCDSCDEDIKESHDTGTTVLVDAEYDDDGNEELWCESCAEYAKRCAISKNHFDPDTCNYSTLGDSNVVLDYYLVNSPEKVRLV